MSLEEAKNWAFNLKLKAFVIFSSKKNLPRSTNGAPIPVYAKAFKKTIKKSISIPFCLT